MLSNSFGIVNINSSSETDNSREGEYSHILTLIDDFKTLNETIHND